MGEQKTKGRCVAIITGAFSIAIAIIYLILIMILDSRGPMLPPPSEALGEVVVFFVGFLQEVQQPYEMLTP